MRQVTKISNSKRISSSFKNLNPGKRSPNKFTLRATVDKKNHAH